MQDLRPLALVPVIGVLLALAASGGDSSPASANHSSPGSVDSHVAHVHDNYFHPEPLSPTWADHSAAQADCQAASPPAQCDLNIEVGDSVEWWSKDPFHAQPHSVTECTDNTFSSCGANVDPDNPIGDSGIFMGGATQDALRHGGVTFDTAGTFYYRCEVHPDEMRGRVVVAAAAAQTPTPTPTPAAPTPTAPGATPTPTAAPAIPRTGGPPADGSGGTLPAVALVLGGAAIAVLFGAGALLLRRR